MRHLAGGKGQAIGLQEGGFSHGNGSGRREHHLVNDMRQPRFDGVRHYHLMHQADSKGLGSVEAFTGDGVAAGLAKAQSIHHMRADWRRRHTNPHLRNAELRRRGRQRHIHAAGNANAAAKTGALDHGEGRLGEFIQFAHGLGSGQRCGEGGLGRVGRHFRQPINIRPGLEMRPGAADHQATNGGIRAELIKPRNQPFQHGGVIGIALMRAVQRGGGDAARINGEQNGWGCFGHGAFL